ncbi:uncharacterized protein LOC131044140 isoform X2 [Cryptomeria japonica]|uniref:uncharacterized protein LOC131044140 isoform X2 n=1 Tax=Cryptomeria japonica TaxID=3369 RepID=UPI0025AC22C1|nr:uncharacterized protein LOC131044140 isoform X2 [Cryptomeria japonica]
MEREGKKGGRFETQKQNGRIESALAECVKETDSWKEQVEAVLQPSLSAAEARVTLMMQHFVESIESQLLSALKQASMDIIEHLGKEAAMRVMVAERKAVHFEKELVNTKQEALNMLVQLKRNMDAQIIEAERACRIERSRAQEMEAKLIATQDTVKKLMNELKEKGEVLEQMQKMAQPLDEHVVVPMHFPTEYSTMQWTSSARQFPKQNTTGKDYLSSVIMKSKANTVSANGLHHGIYGDAINEQNGDALPVLEINENKECLSTENVFSSCSIEKGHVGGDAGHQGQTVMPDVSSFQKEEAQCFLHQSTLVVTCTGQCGSCDGGLVHREGQPSPCSESDASLGTEDKPVATKNSIVKVRNEEKQQDLASFPEISNASFCPQARETKTWGSESSKVSAGDKISTYSGMENPGMTFEDDCRTSTKFVNDVISVMSTLCSSHDDSSLENGGITLETADNQVSGEGGVLIEAVHSNEKTRLSAHLDIDRQECDKAIVIGMPSAAEDSKCSPSSMKYIEVGQSSEIKISTNIPDQCVHIRPTRFTFQRKRRRESPFQQNGKLLQEENNLWRETKQHEYIPTLSGKLPQRHRTTNLMSQKPSSVAESSRDSRRLMQVARQLISLSEKKTW